MLPGICGLWWPSAGVPQVRARHVVLRRGRLREGPHQGPERRRADVPRPRRVRRERVQPIPVVREGLRGDRTVVRVELCPKSGPLPRGRAGSAVAGRSGPGPAGPVGPRGRWCWSVWPTGPATRLFFGNEFRLPSVRTAFGLWGGGGGGCWAPRTRQRHQQEHRPQRPTGSSDPTQHAKGRTGDCPGPRKGATTRRNVTWGAAGAPPPPGGNQALLVGTARERSCWSVSLGAAPGILAPSPPPPLHQLHF